MNDRKLISKRSRRGFLATDALIGLFLVAVLAAALAAGVSHQRRAATRFSNTRAAIRLAERTLMQMQHDGQVPLPVDAADERRVSVRRLPDGASEGHAWYEVTATVRGQSASLIGRARIREGGER